MLISEILSKTLPFTIDEKTKEFFSAEFESNNRTIKFRASLELNDDEQDFWEIEFAERVRDREHHSLSGSGGEFEVFATLKKIIETFIKEYKPKAVTFSADKTEPSRVSAYERMFTRFKVPGYTFAKDTDKSQTHYQHYKLTKNK